MKSNTMYRVILTKHDGEVLKGTWTPDGPMTILACNMGNAHGKSGKFRVESTNDNYFVAFEVANDLFTWLTGGTFQPAQQMMAVC